MLPEKQKECMLIADFIKCQKKAEKLGLTLSASMSNHELCVKDKNWERKFPDLELLREFLEGYQRAVEQKEKEKVVVSKDILENLKIHEYSDGFPSESKNSPKRAIFFNKEGDYFSADIDICEGVPYNIGIEFGQNIDLSEHTIRTMGSEQTINLIGYTIKQEDHVLFVNGDTKLYEFTHYIDASEFKPVYDFSIPKIIDLFFGKEAEEKKEKLPTFKEIAPNIHKCFKDDIVSFDGMFKVVFFNKDGLYFVAEVCDRAVYPYRTNHNLDGIFGSDSIYFLDDFLEVKTQEQVSKVYKFSHYIRFTTEYTDYAWVPRIIKEYFDPCREYGF